MTDVIDIRRDRSVLVDPDVVRIDRATRWGNPFVIGRRWIARRGHREIPRSACGATSAPGASPWKTSRP